MDLQTLLNERNISKYQLSKLSGVPKTTIMDICAGRSDMERCSAKTVQKLAQALGCTMENMMKLSTPYDKKGFSKDRSYLECGLPDFLQESIQAMVKKVDNGENYTLWDCDYCNLQSDINSAEVNQIISPEQAWYLRKKYLRMERETIE